MGSMRPLTFVVLLVATPALAAEDVTLLYAPPGCLDRSTSRFDMKHRLSRNAPPGFRFAGVTLGAFSQGGRLLFPESDFGDPEDVRAFLKASKGAEIERTPIGDALLVETHWELGFTIAAKDALQTLAKELPAGTTTIREAKLSRLRVGDRSVRALEVDPEAPLVDDVLSYVRHPLAAEAVTANGKEAMMWFSGRRAGTLAAFNNAVEKLRPDDKTPLLAIGGFDALLAGDEQLGACVARLKQNGIAASGVRAEELSLGVDGLKRLDIPFVAANLRDAKGERVLPAHRIVHANGKRIAVIGVVDPRAIFPINAEVAAQWRILPPGPALEETIEIANREHVDAVIVLGNDSPGTDLSGTRGADVVIGDFSSLELEARAEEATRASVDRSDAPSAPLFTVRASLVSMGSVALAFDQQRVMSVKHRLEPLWPHKFETSPPVAYGPLTPDPYFARAAQHTDTELPDLTPIVRNTPELQRLVYGDSIVVRGRARRIVAQEPARFSDALWGRFVARIAREEMRVDAALVRNLPRRDDVAGPLTRAVLEGWLPPGERVHAVDLKGDKLLKLVEALVARERDGRTPLFDPIHASGIALDNKLVMGRPIEPSRHYRLAVTDATLAVPEVASIITTKGEEHAVLRSLAIQRIATLSDGSGSGEFTEDQIAEITSLLVDDSRHKQPQWSIRFDDLSASGSYYGNGPGIQTFVNSRETRAATPNLYNLLLNADVGLVFDTPGFAWENRLRGQFSTLVVQVPGIPPQEPLDDIVLSSEVRFGPFEQIGGIPLLPFARAAFDSEFTATPDRTQPGKSLPHQALIQESVGIALRPQGGWLKDMRVGAILQEDLSEATAGIPLGEALHFDGGFVAGLQFMVPLGAAQLISETDARWYIPDGDDRPEDLGIRVRNVERLRVPITEELAISLFVDTFLVSTKNVDVISGSVLVGAGLSFARIFPL